MNVTLQVNTKSTLFRTYVQTNIFLSVYIYIRVQQLHYFIRDQMGYSIGVLQLIVDFSNEIHDEL